MPNSRDAHGRFLKGTTGNPKGRPTKLSMIEPTDFALFTGTMVEIDNPRGGRKRILTREGAIQERLYASAMKGNVHAQIFLTRKFDELKVAQVENQDHLHKIYETLQKEQREPTDDEYARMRWLRMALNLEPKPGAKVKKGRPSRAKGKMAAPGHSPSWEQQRKPEDAAAPSPPTNPAKPTK